MVTQAFQLRALQWKNTKLHLRQWSGLLIEYGLPAVLLLFLVSAHSQMGVKPTEKKSVTFPVTNVLDMTDHAVNALIMTYTPASLAAEKLFAGADYSFPDVRIMTLEEAKRAFKRVKEAAGMKKSEVEAEEAFDTVRLELDDQTTVPKNLKFKVVVRESYDAVELYGTSLQYTEKFLPMVYYTCASFINHWQRQLNLTKTEYPVNILAMPTLATLESERETLLDALRFLFVFFYFGYVCYTTKAVVEDKETKIKESMKLMGLSSTMYWISCLLGALPFGMIITIVVVGACCIPFFDKAGAIFNSSPLLIFIVLFLYTVNITTFAFILSCFINRARNAVVASATLYVVTVYGAALVLQYMTSRATTLFLGTLVPQTGMQIFFSVLFKLEIRRREMAFSNIMDNPAVPYQTGLEAILILILNSIFNMLVVAYVDAVNPGEFGVPQPYNFFLTKEFWCPPDESTVEIPDLPQADSRLFEPAPSDLKPGVMVRGLVKIFGGHIAVAGTSMDLYQDQITVLLGHNGAGKTTTIGMITGFLKPTRGTAIVNGYDITKHLDKARSSLGLCPQHDILFNKLSCKEHLIFYSMLRGQYNNSSNAEIMKLLYDVGLGSKIFTYAMHLSGGQRRKLSVACSFIGNIQTVFLDEPSSGLDPSARRELWDFLKSMRPGRTILLTTHYMDEADVLGDRIVIMAEGIVKCGGTPVFLKRIYGTGYQMNVVKRLGCNIDAVTQLIQKHLPEAKFTGETNSEIYYILPDEKVEVLPSLFEDLENLRDKLHISSFGISATSMEDVFIRVGEGFDPKPYVVEEPPEVESGEVEEKQRGVNEKPSETLQTSKSSSKVSPPLEQGSMIDLTTKQEVPEDKVIADQSEQKLHKGSVVEQERRAQELAKFAAMNRYTKNVKAPLFFQQIKAILIKRATLFRRSIISALIMLLLPSAMTILGIKVDMLADANKVSSPMDFSLNRFSDLIVPIFSSPTGSQKMKDAYKNQFSSSPGVTFRESDVTDSGEVNKYLLKLGHEITKAKYDDKVIFGVVINASSYTNVYHKTALHGIGISMQILMNAYCQSQLGPDYSLQIGVFHELPEVQKMVYGMQLITMLCLGFAMALVPVMYIHGLISERATGAKHLQALSGVNPFAYWLGCFAFDALLLTINAVTIIIAFTYNPGVYISQGRWVLTSLVMMAFVMTTFPHLYAVQVVFKSPANGVLTILSFNFFIGIIGGLIMVSIKATNPNDSYLTAFHWMCVVLSPNYTLIACLLSFTVLSQMSYKDDVSLSTQLKQEILGGSLLDQLLAFGAVFLGSWIVIALTEYRVDRLLWYVLCMDKVCKFDTSNSVSHAEKGQLQEDDDVQRERERIQTTPIEDLCRDNSIVFKNLQKRFRVRCHCFVAVHSSSLALPEDECLGLLGQNGAGKSTTFKMLTGDHMVSGGDAFVKGYSIKYNMKKIHAMMGYCPQHDALHGTLTGTETLYLYGRLRGVPEESLKPVTEAIIDFVTLRPHENKLTVKYSGGNKRKLSVGLSIIGDPMFIMLDEPTAGMDPVARRALWKVLHLIRASGRTLVLTSHSMEECEALCTRIVIMAKGKILCLGSPQHLKNKYAQGYTVILRAQVDEQGRAQPLGYAKEFMVQSFPKTQVFAVQEAYVHLQVPDTVPLSTLFSTLELARQKYQFQFYTVQQTSLEQVFLMFMKDV